VAKKLETLTISDIDLLTRYENGLIFLRKREAANVNSSYLIEYVNETIGKCHTVRQILQSRFNLPVDKDI
jgi:hypothetical protein